MEPFGIQVANYKNDFSIEGKKEGETQFQRNVGNFGLTTEISKLSHYKDNYLINQIFENKITLVFIVDARWRFFNCKWNSIYSCTGEKVTNERAYQWKLQVNIFFITVDMGRTTEILETYAVYYGKNIVNPMTLYNK